MDLWSWFFLVLIAGSLACALAGRRWAPALPLAVAVLGGLMFVTSDPPPPWGGDVDPGRLVGLATLIVAVPLTVACWAAVAVVRRRRERRRPALHAC
jgi:hypothetical protein